MKNKKTKKIFIFITFLCCIMLCSGNLYASEQNIKNTNRRNEKEIDDFLKLQDEQSNSFYQISDDRYFTDSVNFTYPPGVTPGSIYNSKNTTDNPIQYYSADSDDPKMVSEFKMTFAVTETIDSETWLGRYESEFGELDQGNKQYFRENLAPNAHPAKYEVLTDVHYDVTIHQVEYTEINSDGEEIKKYRYVYEFPEDFPNDGTLRAISLSVDGDTYDIHRLYTVYVACAEGDPVDESGGGFDPGSNPDPEPDPEPGSAKSYAYVESSLKMYEHLSPTTKNASITSPIYDVEKAIPTSEELTYNTTVDDGLYQIGVRTYRAVAGVNSIDLTASANYKYTVSERYLKKPEVKNDSGEVIEKAVYGTRRVEKIGTINKTVASDYSTSVEKTYYDVPISRMYPVTSVSFFGAPINTSIPLNGTEKESAKNIRVTTTTPRISGASYGIYLGTFDNKRDAEKALNNTDVKDRIITSLKSNVLYPSILMTNAFEGYNYRGLSVTPTSNNNVTPEVRTASGGAKKIIPSTASNGNYNASAKAGYLGYSNFDIGVNNVFVHTPVINNAIVQKITQFINQRTVIEPNVEYLMLDEVFKINISNEGTHISRKGYNTRTYNSGQGVYASPATWGKVKDVKLPFDAYFHAPNGEKILIKAGMWLSEAGFSSTHNEFTFTIPVWAKEGKGVIETRVIAENANGSNIGKTQAGANLDFNNYVATKNIDVEVIGKIYDLRISGTNDPGWSNIKGKYGNYVTTEEFAFGQPGQNGMQAYNYAPKLGYIIEFDFKTKGIKTDNVDVSIEPEGFYFVGKNGGEAQEVDLYYQVAGGKYVKIEKDSSNSLVYVNLSNTFMKVIVSELIDSQRIMKNTIGVLYTYAENVNIGSIPKLNLPEKLRLTFNNFSEYANKLYAKTEPAIAVDAANGLAYSTKGFQKVTDGRDVVIASVGHWYAGYRLPSSTIAVPVGTTVQQIVLNPNLAKKDGYILVKFDIVGNSGTEDYLKYKGPESLSDEEKNGKNPGGSDPNSQDPDKGKPTKPVVLPNGKPGKVPDGTTIMFEAGLKANNDFEVEGTH